MRVSTVLGARAAIVVALALAGPGLSGCGYSIRAPFDPSIRAMAQYTYGFGTLIWPQNDGWCRSS